MKNVLKRSIAVLLFAAAAVILTVTGIHCPIKYLTSLPCPGCGMTRAVLALLRGDFTGAVYCHPLIFTLPFIAALFLFYDRLPKKVTGALCICFGLLFIAVFVIRLFLPGSIIYFRG